MESNQQSSNEASQELPSDPVTNEGKNEMEKFITIAREKFDTELNALTLVEQLNEANQKSDKYRYVKNKLQHMKNYIIKERESLDTANDIGFVKRFYVHGSFHEFIVSTLEVIKKFTSEDIIVNMMSVNIPKPGEKMPNLGPHWLPNHCQITKEKTMSGFIETIEHLFEKEDLRLNETLLELRIFNRCPSVDQMRNKLTLMKKIIESDMTYFAAVSDLNFVLQVHFEGKAHYYIADLMRQFTTKMPPEGKLRMNRLLAELFDPSRAQQNEPSDSRDEPEWSGFTTESSSGDQPIET